MTTRVTINPHISESKSVNRAKRVSNAVSMLLPVVLAIGLVVGLPLSWAPSFLAVLLTIGFFVLGALGLAIGYHRYFAHHAFKTSALGRIVLGVLGAWALQGSIISWVADHRRHHRFSDQQYDPHSPYTDDNGMINNRLAGWWHAHIGWMLTGNVSDEKRYASDCLHDPVVVFLSRHYWSIAIAGLLAPGAMGWLLGGRDEAALCIFWAGCVRTVLIHQLAWSANSFGHMHGTKVEASQDESRNNAFLGIMLMGEGWHSYHHQHPTLAMNEPAQFDGGGHVLIFLERFGLVWALRKAKKRPVTAFQQMNTDSLHGTATI